MSGEMKKVDIYGEPVDKIESEWITVENGEHVPIDRGQSKAEAVKRHFEEKANCHLTNDKNSAIIRAMESIDELEKSLKHKLKENPELLLPNAHNVQIDERKYTHYLFGGDFQSGLNKGSLITRYLGYGLSNYKEFDKKIKAAVLEFPAIFKGTTLYGDSYEIITVIKGLTERKAKVVLGARVDSENSKIVTIYIKEVKKV